MTLDDIKHEIQSLTVEQRKQLIVFVVDSLVESAPQPEENKRSILEFEGVGSEIWQDIDTQDYLNQLRDEWD